MRCGLFAALIFLLAGSAAAQPGGAADARIQKLGHAEWTIREQAFRDLITDTDPRTDQRLEAAAGDADAEIRYRARELLLIRKFHVIPEYWEELLPLIHAFENAAADDNAQRIGIITRVADKFGHKALPMLMAFLAGAPAELQIEIARMIVAALEQVPREGYGPIVTGVYEQYADYFYNPAFDPDIAQLLGRDLAGRLPGISKEFYRDILMVLTELGDVETGLELALNLYRNGEMKELAEVVNGLKPEEETDIYLVGYFRIFSRGLPAGEEQDLVAAHQALYPMDETIHFRAAHVITAADRITYAEQEFRRVIAIKPDDSQYDINAEYSLAQNAFMRLDYTEAIGLFENTHKAAQRIGWDFDDARIYALYARGYECLETGRLEEAGNIVTAAEAELGIEKEPGDFKHLEYEILYARWLWLKGDLAERDKRAKKVFQRYNARRATYSGQDREAFWSNNVAWYLGRVGYMPATAIEYSQRSLEIEPGSSMYLDTLAECSFAAGDTDAAITHIKLALTNNKSELMAVYYGRQLVRFEKALAAEKNALKEQL